MVRNGHNFLPYEKDEFNNTFLLEISEALATTLG